MCVFFFSFSHSVLLLFCIHLYVWVGISISFAHIIGTVFLVNIVQQKEKDTLETPEYCHRSTIVCEQFFFLDGEHWVLSF